MERNKNEKMKAKENKTKTMKYANVKVIVIYS